jgi:predicted transcriptional regulator
LKPRKLTTLELRIMESLWERGPSSVRQIHESLPTRGRPAYTTIQTTIYRLEAKGSVRCVARIGHANVFEAAVSRETAQHRLVDDLIRMFNGNGSPIMARLVDAGTLTLEDLKDAEKALRRHLEKKEAK